MSGTSMGLPEQCAARENGTGAPIMIRRGDSGFYPIANTEFDVVLYNQRKGVTAAQVEAMIVGSMFGWHVPGADPAKCDGQIAQKFVERA
jgi:hypothetical protein